MTVELQGRLLAWEKELHSRERVLMAREDGLAPSERAVGRARMECDDECDRAEAVRQDYQARVRAFIAGCWHSLDFDRVLEGRWFFLFVQETYLERQEERLAEEQARGLYPFDGRDLSVELEKLRRRVAGVESECVTEAMQLSWSVMEIFDALVDLGVFPIWDIPAHSESAQDVPMAANLVLKHLREEHASSIGS
jgi:hypothetical protein